MKTSTLQDRTREYLAIAKVALYVIGIMAAVYLLFKAIHEFMWLCYYAGIPM